MPLGSIFRLPGRSYTRVSYLKRGSNTFEYYKNELIYNTSKEHTESVTQSLQKTMKIMKANEATDYDRLPNPQANLLTMATVCFLFLSLTPI